MSSEGRDSLTIEFYEVEEIRGKRVQNGRKEYLVKWKGFSEEECTWEPLSNLDACAKMIAKYEKEHSIADEKMERPNTKSPRPEKSNKNSKQLKSKEDNEVTFGKHAKEAKDKSKSQVDDERFDTRFDVLKRTTIDNEVVFKVIDGNSKKEIFVSRKDLLKDDPVALCLFYEKHIVS